MLQAVGLQEREALLRGWTELQAELRALHDVWQSAQAAALAQRDQVGLCELTLQERVEADPNIFGNRQTDGDLIELALLGQRDCMTISVLWQVSAAAGSVELAADNVSAAREHLAAGER